jgi:hypothetical protein
MNEMRVSFELRDVTTNEKYVAVRMWAWPDEIRIEVDKNECWVYECNVKRTEINDAFLSDLKSKLEDATKYVSPLVALHFSATGGLHCRSILSSIQDFVRLVMMTVDSQAR